MPKNIVAVPAVPHLRAPALACGHDGPRCSSLRPMPLLYTPLTRACAASPHRRCSLAGPRPLTTSRAGPLPSPLAASGAGAHAPAPAPFRLCLVTGQGCGFARTRLPVCPLRPCAYDQWARP